MAWFQSSQFWTYLLPAHAWLAHNYNSYLQLHSLASLSALYPHIFLILEEDDKKTELTDCKNPLETHRQREKISLALLHSLPFFLQKSQTKTKKKREKREAANIGLPWHLQRTHSHNHEISLFVLLYSIICFVLI